MRCRRLAVWCALSALWLSCGDRSFAADEGQAPKVDFNREIRPILSKSCFACHGPDEKARKAGLRLDERDAATRELGSGMVAIVPGKPGESELYIRIASEDELERMPPKESGHELTPAQIQTFKRWIEQGASFAEHWSFVKPQRPELPAVQGAAWPKNPIDFFILHRLEQAGLKPSPEADRYMLIRRLSLDLRGLPPTPAEVDAFVNDTSSNAYEKLVDKFLSDTAYGERWARLWLDLARYADSKGLGSDPLRTIWRYRDWVIDAFNRNLPFDKFTVEQIAGDLLPQATLEQRIATAFHRNTMTNTEGGTDDEEFRQLAVKDRADTTVQVWMGVTFGCAKCHNHKYDPISQAEYYSLYAILNQTADNDQPDDSPVIPAPTPAISEQIQKLDAQIAALKKQLDTPTPEMAAAQEKWEVGLRVQPEWRPLEIVELKADGGTTLKTLDDGSILAAGENPANSTYTVAARTNLKNITAFRLETIPDESLPAKGAGRAADGNFVLSKFGVTIEDAQRVNQPPKIRHVRIELPGKNKILSLAEVQVFSGGKNVARGGKATQSSVDYNGPPELAIDGNTSGVFDEKSTTHTKQETDPWWEVDLGDEREIESITLWNRTDNSVGSRLADFRIVALAADRKPVWKQEVAASPTPSAEFAPSGRSSVSLSQAAADFSQKDFPAANALNQKDLSKSGWAVGPEIAKPHAAYFVGSAAVGDAAVSLLTFRLEHRYSMPQFTLGRFRLTVTDSAEVLRRVSVPAEILAIVDLPESDRSDEQKSKLAAHYRSIAPGLKPVRDEIAKLEKSKPEIPTVPVIVELPADKRRTTKIMIKGNFLETGATVDAGVPAKFHPLKTEGAPDRLALAKWLVDRDNPLTARVMANRFWAQLFGVGLVETEEDFGMQGELPTHPQLLDWLAVEFMQTWDMKELLKTMVMSAAYRQTSLVTPEKLEADPRNRLVSRGPRFRLEAEMVRDQALALAGLLSRKTHGPSVYPPQPPGLWQAAFNGQRTWETSKGEDRYRRGLYTFLRRTIPYPSMATFDAPSREICTIRRIRTNTPLQAFVTLNDPVYVEAAQGLARRIIKEGGSTTADRARYALKLCLARPPHEDQVQELVALHAEELKHFEQDTKAAAELATDPLGPLPQEIPPAEAAAWTVVANVLLNMDGVLAKN
jgi:hypothetical protein